MSFAPPLFVALIERLAAAHTTNVERRMSVQVQQLADIVRKAKTAIATAGDSATRLEGSAQRVLMRVAEVESMNTALNAAEAELATALGSSSNGGAPLSDTSSSLPQPSPVDAVAASVTQVQNANASAQ
jgi:hypothetical protein